MRNTLASLACIAGIVLVAGPVAAEIGTLDNVPAATLLLPYFEVAVDLPVDQPPVDTTVFTIANSSATATVAHVTLWTDLGIPTFTFDLYLTGYDTEVIDLRLLFAGIPPVSADDGADPGDTADPNTGVSNQGIFSQDINFPGSSGPCGSVATLYRRLTVDEVAALRAAHTGQPSDLMGGNCAATDRGDARARGFVTVDTVNSCNLSFPSDAGYDGLLTTQNILFGEYWVIDDDFNSAHGEPLVAVEASLTDPRTDGPGDYTFYGRLNGGSGADHREGLPTVWMGRYINGGVLDGGTTAYVWRDAWPGAAFACGTPIVGLSQASLIAFDEQEAVDFLPVADYLPLAAEAVDLADPARIPLEFSFGFVQYDLKRAVPAGPFGSIGQSHVIHSFKAVGRFEGAFAVWPLDNVSAPLSPYVGELPACMNGVDDDLDGLTDFPEDPSCRYEDFPSEDPQCNDGDDNDLDGFIDLADPQCIDVFDLFENF